MSGRTKLAEIKNFMQPKQAPPNINNMNADMHQALMKKAHETESVKCAYCGSTSFIQVFEIKTLSPLVSPTGQEMDVNFGRFHCVNCKNPYDKAQYKKYLEEKAKKDPPKKT
jgi:DNA-directed RNA polymerase subunit RPC12/RpoP